MTKVSGKERGQRPKLDKAALHNAASAVVRIKEAGAFDGRDGRVFWISTEEPADHIMFLSGSDLRAITERFGDESDEWAGQLVPLEFVRRAYGGRTYEKYAVPPPDEWDGLLNPKPKAKAKPKARKKKGAAQPEAGR